jgi:hypothetical protein
MRRLLDHRIQQVARRFRHTIIVALSALLLPTVGWAHTCGPGELAVEKGDTIAYSITGNDVVPSHQIVDKGNPLVAIIESPMDKQVDLKFKITGTGDGTTVFKIYWQGPSYGEGTCSVKVTVSG